MDQILPVDPVDINLFVSGDLQEILTMMEIIMAALMHSENKETIVESMMYLSEQAQEDFKQLI